MSVEFIGLIATRKASEIHAADGPAIDRDYVRRFAQAHEAAGFDRVVVKSALFERPHEVIDALLASVE